MLDSGLNLVQNGQEKLGRPIQGVLAVNRSFLLSCLIGVLCLAGLPYCGQWVDADNNIIAEMDGKPIRQRTFKRYLRNLPEEERPLIQTKSDQLRALNVYIEERIKMARGRELEAAGLIQVSRERAKQIYFAKHPERYGVWSMTDPKAAGFDLTERDLEALKAQDEFGFDDEEDRLLREAALDYLARRAHAQGTIAVSDEDYEAEYAARRDQLVFHEEVTFTGVQYPMDESAGARGQEMRAAALAASALDRLDKGMSFEEYLEQEKAAHPARIMENSVIANDPNSDKYRDFWEVASGSEAGQILSALLPPYTVTTESGSGEIFQVAQKGAAHLVFKVLTHVPSRRKTLEEANQELTPRILRRKMMDRLREELGVVVNEDLLEDPGGYGDQFKNSFIKTTVE